MWKAGIIRRAHLGAGSRLAFDAPMIARFLQPILRLFSSVTFGVVLLGILFVYMSIGSAGVLYPVHPNLFHPDAWVHAQLRQWRPFEMTEFEWFHWWPFDLLLALIGVTMVVTTIRRIPFRPVNFGVWMIHSGIILLILGSVLYFGTKVEGETPVVRRSVRVSLLDEDGRAVASGVLLAMPGSRTTVGEGPERLEVEIRSTDPAWELLSGPDKGERAYSVNVLVQGPGQRFIRQVIAGFPQYTEDLIFTQDATQPMKRAVKETGRPLVNERIRVELDYAGQPWFYLKNDLNKSWALYLRRPGTSEWAQRPIHGLPLYNDYVSSTDAVFGAEDIGLVPDPIRVAIPPVEPGDPAPGVVLEATGFLRYAQERTRWVDGGSAAPSNPIASVSVSDGRGRQGEYRLVARDPQQRSKDGGIIALREITNEGQLDALREEPHLVFRIPALGVEVRERIRDAAAADPSVPFRPIGSKDSGYSYRVSSIQDDLPIAGREVSVAVLELRTPAGEFRRWTFSDPALTRDLAPGETSAQAMAHGGRTTLDPTLQVEYQPGNGLALVLLVAGPEPGQLRLLDTLGRDTPELRSIEPGKPVRLAGELDLTVTDWLPRAVALRRPGIVPVEQRARDARELLSMMELSVPEGPRTWLKYHPFVFDRPEDVLRRYWLEPVTLRLPDGSSLEVLFSRQRQPLPTTVALERFELATNIGGFTGATSSIRNYTSVVRFEDAPGEWGPPMALSVNEPVEHMGLSFFQSQWDPPEEARQGGLASAGLNYTVLGVGNRNGVWVQLAGCVVAVIGMMYAFYVKPVIKRRQRALVVHEIEAARAEGRAPHFGHGGNGGHGGHGGHGGNEGHGGPGHHGDGVGARAGAGAGLGEGGRPGGGATPTGSTGQASASGEESHV